jgi:hypothetical protein
MSDDQRPGLRIGDAERESTAALLRRHAAEGRLTLDELDDRLQQVYAAKTAGDLNAQLEDLPSIRTEVELVKPDTKPVSRQEQRAACRQERRGGRGGPSSLVMWSGWISTNLILIAIWVLTNLGGGDNHWNPWFLWYTVPTAIGLISREVSRRTAGRELEG